MSFSVDAQCRPCKGTGLYVGIAERDGSAVVCHTCKGTGREHISVDYTPFVRRQPPPEGVTHVLRVNPGIVVGKGKDGSFSLTDFGGVPLTVWEESPEALEQPGTEMRAWVCPAWWYQSADYDKKPSWNDAERKCGFGRSFSSCDFFAQKAGCWEKWDREQGK